jgi:tetratricopeptide (TPR) repeat protein
MKRLTQVLLAATFIYPAMLLFYAIAPMQAISVYLFLTWILKATTVLGIICFIAVAILYPPFLENFRRFRQRLMRRMTADWREIQNMEQRMSETPTLGLAMDLGKAYCQLEDYPNAAKYLEQAIQMDQDVPVSVRFRLGLVYLNLEQPEKSLPLFKTVQEREPDHASAEVLLRLGDTCRLLGDFSKARDWYDAFERYSAGTPELYHNLSLLHEAEGNRSGARHQMKRALECYQRMDPSVRRRYQLHAAKARWFLLARRAGKGKRASGIG